MLPRTVQLCLQHQSFDLPQMFLASVCAKGRGRYVRKAIGSMSERRWVASSKKNATPIFNKFHNINNITSSYERQWASRANLHDESWSELWFVFARRFSDTQFAYKLPFQISKIILSLSWTIRCFKNELRAISGCRSKRPPYPRPEDCSMKL